MTIVIGLTGGIGSGKSTVSKFLGVMGAVIIDADKVGHEAFQPGTEAHKDVVAAFGEQVLSLTGEIDRKKLAEIVFSNSESLLRLNRIMHPRMFQMMKGRIEELKQKGVDVIVIEAAILIEANWTPLVDQVWVTVSPKEVVLERVESQRGQSKEQTSARIRNQMSSEERVKHADVVIENSGTLEELRAKVKELWDRLHRS